MASSVLFTQATANDTTSDPLFVTPTTRKTFSTRNLTPAGTIFYVKVLKKAPHNAIRLHRCSVPCNTAVTVKIWEPDSYKSGDELSWRVDQAGTYYFWNQDRSKKAAVVATSDQYLDGKLQITFKSGAILEVWYTKP